MLCVEQLNALGYRCSRKQVKEWKAQHGIRRFAKVSDAAIDVVVQRLKAAGKLGAREGYASRCSADDITTTEEHASQAWRQSQPASSSARWRSEVTTPSTPARLRKVLASSLMGLYGMAPASQRLTPG